MRAEISVPGLPLSQNLGQGAGGTYLEVVSLSRIFFFFFLVLLGLHLWHMEVPRLGVKLELLLPAYTIARVPDPSCLFDLYHSS